MNDQTLLALAALTLAAAGETEKNSWLDRLHVPVTAVLAGDAALTGKQRGSLRYLFSDYEWMLANKVAVQNETAPAEQGVGWRYQNAKATIALAWLQAGAATAVTQSQSGTAHLEIRRGYGVRGLDDILDFAVPAPVAKKLQMQKLDLLEWAQTQLPAPGEATD
ncbi:hypothetical protein [Lacticaseibacillus kribbianus]|uniref:hypothetical protein n=1 Tax=Lacticaseibacillus kribbianus TaxID=2926292 RepID=UPI001CD2EFF8|nr:hypothetical protein [Lacticaseibacillus kribbianus]